MGIIITLIGGVTIMYHTQAFWGLEDNANASTLNATFNSMPNLTAIVIMVVVFVAIVLVMTTTKGFG